MTNIPEDIMAKARDLDRVGCGCDEVEAQTCEHVHECLCTRQEKAIARALLAEREEADKRGYDRGLRDSARVAEFVSAKAAYAIRALAKQGE